MSSSCNAVSKQAKLHNQLIFLPTSQPIVPSYRITTNIRESTGNYMHPFMNKMQREKMPHSIVQVINYEVMPRFLLKHI
ncbi:hypothetical protein EUGRSUZ_F04182 [Eucalyptus grandis]|uniref:Uncharacterized protein n=2 Tax=Eucalyptus grandis TaxID=71139 RepID=A0ACC3KP96_EUCGR|nr:hypothetical protein EUGRSUZ_F04182 [Eucalyptus grandis]